jgi:hypothetical protein
MRNGAEAPLANVITINRPEVVALIEEAARKLTRGNKTEAVALAMRRLLGFDAAPSAGFLRGKRASPWATAAAAVGGVREGGVHCNRPRLQQSRQFHVHVPTSAGRPRRPYSGSASRVLIERRRG